jgi:hypothetical protein
MRGVCRDVDGGPSAHHRRLAAKGEFQFALQRREHLLEIMPMRGRAAAIGNKHLDKTTSPGGLSARNQNRVDAAGHGDMRDAGIVKRGNRQFPVRVVGGMAAGKLSVMSRVHRGSTAPIVG